MKVLLFGILAEKAGADMLELEVESTLGLRRRLSEKVPDADLLSYAIAVDRRIVHDDIRLTGNEEIALLPPFAGG